MKTPYFRIALILLILIGPGWSCTKTNNDLDTVTGTVLDYSDLDGCGFVIELDDGTRLEPAEVSDTGFVFSHGQRVELSYTLLKDMGSICMVGEIVRIETIREIGCLRIQDLSNGFVWEDLPDTKFDIKSAKVNGNCLELEVGYSGGCENHHFFPNLMPAFCGTPPIPPPTILLCHEGNGDLCEAYISETIYIDLTSLRVPGSQSVVFQLILNFEGSNYSETFTYFY